MSGSRETQLGGHCKVKEGGDVPWTRVSDGEERKPVTLRCVLKIVTMTS